jgi:AraC-like DNA-binding protein
MAEPDACARLLTDAERVTGLSIAVHDRTGCFQSHGLGSRYAHRHAFCQAGRYSLAGYDRRCREHCWQEQNRRAAETGEPFVHSCWKGGAEACAPVFRDGVHLLTLFGGVLAAAAQPPAGLEAPARRAWRTLPPPDPARLAAVAQVLAAVGQGMLALLDEERRRGAGSRREAIERFIAAELHRPLTVAQLGRHLGLSPSRTAHVVTALFGKPFIALLQERRIARAKHLLLSGEESVGTIAARCGCVSQHWFSRLFTRVVGEPPGRWRRTHLPPA